MDSTTLMFFVRFSLFLSCRFCLEHVKATQLTDDFWHHQTEKMSFEEWKEEGEKQMKWVYWLVWAKGSNCGVKEIVMKRKIRGKRIVGRVWAVLTSNLLAWTEPSLDYGGNEPPLKYIYIYIILLYVCVLILAILLYKIIFYFP